MDEGSIPFTYTKEYIMLDVKIICPLYDDNVTKLKASGEQDLFFPEVSSDSIPKLATDLVEEVKNIIIEYIDGGKQNITIVTRSCSVVSRVQRMICEGFPIHAEIHGSDDVIEIDELGYAKINLWHHVMDQLNTSLDDATFMARKYLDRSRNK